MKPAIALIVLLASTAQAQKQEDTIGVLEVETEGVSETAGERFEESVEGTLSDVGLRVVRSAAVRDKLAAGDYVTGCTFGPCLSEVRRLTGLSRVMVARIRGVGQSYSVVVSIVDTGTGTLVSQVAQSCPVCTFDEAVSTATLAVVEAITKPPSSPKPADRKKKLARRTGWAFIAVGAAALTGGLLLASNDSDGAGVVAGGGGGLALAGVTTLLLSVSF
jgi:hypothetical protein